MSEISDETIEVACRAAARAEAEAFGDIEDSGYLNMPDWGGYMSVDYFVDVSWKEYAVCVRAAITAYQASAEYQAMAAAAQRWHDACRDPVGTRHLLHLLSEGKGDIAALNSMMDRIRVSRDAAIDAAGGEG
jgi:hypothetical protein